MNPSRKAGTPNVHDVQVRLDSIPGVEEADLSSFPASVSIRVSPGEVGPLLAESIRALLLGEFDTVTDVQIVLDQASLTAGSRRARYRSLQVTQPTPGWLRARLELEWKDTTFVGEADGEYNPAGELRVCASAALRAVEKTADSQVSFTLVGVKELQVFDHNLVVVLINSRQLPEQRLIGTSIITESRREAAARAALNATNRVMGRYTDG